MRLPDICQSSLKIRVKYLALVGFMARIDGQLDKTEINLLKKMSSRFGVAEKYEKEIIEGRDYSEEEVVSMIKEILLNKSQEFKNIDIEDLRKNWRKAFANGLTVLGMLHGAHYMADATGPKSEREKSPTYQRIQQEREAKNKEPSSNLSPEEQIKQAREQARAEGNAIYNKYNKTV